MTPETNIKKQIYQRMESLPVERWPDLLRFLHQFLQLTTPEATAKAAPIYQIHQHTVNTGVPDLAAQHDHYLYVTSKHDA